MNILPEAYMIWDPGMGYVSGGLIVMAIFGCLVMTYLRIRKRYRGGRAAMLLLPRIAVAGMLLMLFFNPKWAATRKVQEDLRFLVLSDRSASMEVVDRDDASRADRAAGVEEDLQRLLPDTSEVVDRPFIDDIPGEQEVRKEARVHRRTDIAQVLARAIRSHRSESWDGVVLLTDGGDERFRLGTSSPVPVYFYVLGADAGRDADIAINGVDAPANVELGAEFEVDAELRAYGAGKISTSLDRVGVELQRQPDNGDSWETIERHEVDLHDGRAEVSFVVDAPEPEGQHSMRVRIDPVAGELTELNNERHFGLQVTDSSLEVLLFSASPGQNEMILRRSLEDDPGIDVTSLLRLEEEQYLVQTEQETDISGLQEGFPESPDDLRPFDVVVVGSFPADMWNEKQMGALKESVRRGSAAVFLGGEESFGLGGYAGTPLEPLYPWRIGPDEPDLDVGARDVTVAPAVVRQSLIRGWAEKMSDAHPLRLHSLNRPGRLRRGAVPLLNAGSNGGRVPVLALQPYGGGHVMGVATNTLWRWRTAGGRKRIAYDHLWRQGMRYLAGVEEGGSLLRVSFDRDHYYTGETAEIDVDVVGNYREGELRVDARKTGDDLEATLPMERRPGSPGRFRTSDELRRSGDYVFQFTAYLNNEELDRFRREITVGARLNEGADVYPDRDFLTDIAASTGGETFGEGQEEQLAERLREQAVRRENRRLLPLLQYRGIYLVLILLILGAEWTIRRRMNLF